MESPKDTLNHYIAEMKDWEIGCAERDERCVAGEMDFVDAERMGMEKYMEIFNSYCSSKLATPRDFHYATPPDYDPEKHKIIETLAVSPEVVEIRTKEVTGLHQCFAYRLALEAGKWKLFEKFYVSDGGELIEASL